MNLREIWSDFVRRWKIKRFIKKNGDTLCKNCKTWESEIFVDTGKRKPRTALLADPSGADVRIRCPNCDYVQYYIFGPGILLEIDLEKIDEDDNTK